MLDWESLFKRYVWDADTTPYFTPVAKLNRYQADHEVYAFCMFIGVIFAVVAVAALTDASMIGRSPIAGLYAFSVVAASIIFNYTKVVWSALWLAIAPLAGLAVVLFYGFDGERVRVDSIIVGGICVLILIYMPRLIGVARAYPDLPEPETPPPRRRRLFK